MEGDRKKLEKIYQALNEEDTDIKKWNQALIPKALLLFPPIAYALIFFNDLAKSSKVVKPLCESYLVTFMQK